ncbi:LysR family transcriptional regulator [Arenibacterium halophilum]|uniref:LysR family transcriptional regulator n=1 Tax=Arenibacterium halophilum TaxID=2583821 RepID=A0ABY2X5E3_9RHOB|nr:LysR family transcriptional regulator [Arenibacterium halophilum]TMV10666.1 LysR family transcriptional regulator [Arenibacterium halophilum]
MSWKEWLFALGIPKSRLSRQVKTLEEVLGNQLLNRGSRHMALTAAGEAFIRHARMALDCMVAAEAAAAEGPGAIALPAYVCGANRMEGPMTSAMRPERPSAIFSNMVALMS